MCTVAAAALAGMPTSPGDQLPSGVAAARGAPADVARRAVRPPSATGLPRLADTRRDLLGDAGTTGDEVPGDVDPGTLTPGSVDRGPDDRAAWSPPTPLPAPATDSRRVDIVLSPHPDDETLSLGVWAADAVARGDRVIVVALTDGRTTGAITKVALRLRRRVTRDEIAAARIRELDAAAAQLGVRPTDVYRAQLDDEAGPGGTRLTEPEAYAVIEAFAARFPSATFATMSWVAERHPDHLGAGLALHRAVADGVVQHAVFAVSRLWWALPSPPASEVLPLDAAVRRRVLLAAEAYDLWNPAAGRLAVGWTSVHQQFTAMVADPRDRMHGSAPGDRTALAQPAAG